MTILVGHDYFFDGRARRLVVWTAVGIVVARRVARFLAGGELVFSGDPLLGVGLSLVLFAGFVLSDLGRLLVSRLIIFVIAVRWWSSGGETSLANLMNLCRLRHKRHYAEVASMA